MKGEMTYKGTNLTNIYVFNKYPTLNFGLENFKIFGFMQCFVVT